MAEKWMRNPEDVERSPDESAAARPAGGDSVVRKGGIGDEADAEDVTRDTYGFTETKAAGSDLTPEEARARLDDILPVESEDDET